MNDIDIIRSIILTNDILSLRVLIFHKNTDTNDYQIDNKIDKKGSFLSSDLSRSRNQPIQWNKTVFHWKRMNEEILNDSIPNLELSFSQICSAF